MLWPILRVLLGLLFTFSAFAQELSPEGFHNRFFLERKRDGSVKAVRLKGETKKFSLLPFIKQLEDDFTEEQKNLNVAEATELLNELGDTEEVKLLKKSIQGLKQVSVKLVFSKLKNEKFWKKAEKKLNDAFLFTDPSYLANLENPRFFYKRRIVYEVTKILMDIVRGQFIEIPIVHMANFIIRRAHWMMMEQRHYYQNMILYYMEQFEPWELGLTTAEAKRVISSIYEYRIFVLNPGSSDFAKKRWEDFGVMRFYNQIYNDSLYMNIWAKKMGLTNVVKMNFGFAAAQDEEGMKIYHLHERRHLFSDKPALAFDFKRPDKLRKMRSILNVAGLALGFISIPGLVIKDAIYLFIESLYVGQVRMEGALVAHYESRGNEEMVKKILAQRANYYILE